MRELSYIEIMSKQVELEWTDLLVRHMLSDNIKLYEYQSNQERVILRKKDWIYECPSKKLIGIKINKTDLNVLH